MSGHRTLWVLPDGGAPLSNVVAAYRRRHGPADVLCWQQPLDGDRQYGRTLTLRRSATGYDVTIKAISPLLTRDLRRRTADTIIVLELDLATLYAIASSVFTKRRVVALIEGDVTSMGTTGSAWVKRVFRRAVARLVDGFVANNEEATCYLVQGLGVPVEKVVQGWWLAGLPDDLIAVPPSVETLGRGSGPIFLAVGQLIERKGHDLLLKATAAYTREVGPCRTWIIGQGPDRGRLEALAARLGTTGSTTFFGQVDHAQLKGALEACDAFVFPTLGDLIGRALVESLSTGTPVVVSCHSGAIGTLVRDGDNGVVVDPRDPTDLLRGLVMVTDPGVSSTLRAGAERTMGTVSVGAAADVIDRGVRAAD